MSDIYSKTKRSLIMSRIRGTQNLKTELVLARLLRKYGIVGWRRHQRLKGRPDFVFPTRRVVIFVDGCFWHNCPLHGSQPSTNKAFWLAKIRQNQQRDRLVNTVLKNSGWAVLRIWQHELTKTNESKCINRIRRVLSNERRFTNQGQALGKHS